MTDAPWDEEVTPLPTDEQVERLREIAEKNQRWFPPKRTPEWQAADTIETQRAEIERLRKASRRLVTESRKLAKASKTFTKFGMAASPSAVLEAADKLNAALSGDKADG